MPQSQAYMTIPARLTATLEIISDESEIQARLSFTGRGAQLAVFDRIIGVKLSFCIALTTASAVVWVGAKLRSRYAIVGTTPADMPSSAKSGFVRMQLLARSSKITLGGIQVFRSKLLKQRFPDYCFVRSHLNTPFRSVGQRHGMHIFAVPLRDGKLYEIRPEQNDAYLVCGEFLASQKYHINDAQDAAQLERVFKEICPPSLGVFTPPLRSDQGEWRLGSDGLIICVNNDGLVTHVKPN